MPPPPQPVLPRRRLLPGARSLSLVLFAALFLGAFLYLPHEKENFTPTANGFRVAAEFFSHAFSPAFIDQSDTVPAGITPFWIRCIYRLADTFIYALIALSLAVPTAFVLGFFASRAWWPSLPFGKNPNASIRILRFALGIAFVCTRFFIAFLRSIHELLWATLFLAAVGDFPFAACLALALPFTGTLAKVFAELIDETPTDAKSALTASGASSLQSFFAALVPRALPDFFTYTLYRLECAVRSAAILGFIGIETIGLYIDKSFENFYYGEVWTELYLLLIAIIALDRWSAAVRRRLNDPIRRQSDAQTAAELSTVDPAPAEGPTSQVAALRRARPRSNFLRVSLFCLIAAVIASWVFAVTDSERPLFGGPTWEKRMENLERFSKKLTPEPVRESGDWADAIPWITKIWDKDGAAAAAYTLAVSLAAILLAALGATLSLPLASRVLARSHPFELAGGEPSKWVKWLWRGTGTAVRFAFVAARALPEYMIAFFLIAIFGVTPWALVFALALHNFGILGRLWGEVVENSPPGTPRLLAAYGASRAQVFLTAVVPHAFGKFVLYLFYRWETCIREAVILGFLSVPTLGFFISEERAFLRYDSMSAFVLIGAAIVIVGDLSSDLLRRWIRNA